MSKEDFVAKHLPIDDAKYDLLIGSGLDGYKLMNGFSGNVYLAHGDKNILSLGGDVQSEIIPELNSISVVRTSPTIQPTQKRTGKRTGKGKNKSHRNKKSRKNRKTSRR